MFARLPRVGLTAFCALAVLACQPQAGDGSDDAAARAASTSESPAYAPMGTEGASVVIRPEGDILIAAVDGEPVIRNEKGTVVTANAAGDEFNRLLLPPGSYVLTLGMVGGGGEMVDVSVDANGGDYIFAALRAVDAGRTVPVLAVIEGGPDGKIIASAAPALVGRSRAEAEKLLAASPEERQRMLSSEPASGEQRSERAKAYFEQGQQYLRQGQQENALIAFDGAIAAAPEFAPAYLLRGIALLNLQRPEEAVATFDRSIAIAEEKEGAQSEWLAGPFYYKGTALMAIGQMDRAEAALDRSLALKPTPPGYAARANLFFAEGRAMSRQGDEGKARALFERSRKDADAGLALQTDNVALWSIKSGAHFGLGHGEQGCRAAKKACEFGNCTIMEKYPQCEEGSQ